MKITRKHLRRIIREQIKVEQMHSERSITRPEIEDAIQDASFNSNNSSSHRWSPGQPYIDYYFDAAAGSWKFQAAFPDGTDNANNWPRFPEGRWSSESVEAFLSNVKETLHQPSLPLEIPVGKV